MVDPVDDALGLVEYMTTAATTDPLSAALLLSGTLLIGVSVVVGAWLTLGAVAESVRSIVA